MKLILNMPFININKYINAERSHRQMGARIKRQQTDSVMYLVLEQRFKLEPNKYDVIFNWYKPNNKADHDNIAASKKSILDGIVKAGALPNDTPRYINNFQDNFILDKTKDYVSCVVIFNQSNFINLK